ncbi:hypothetical protein NPIL_544211 [Nephila pilipes]|uniref:Uncharacterized protein n=1 Tax=Nephila pilipes TaxID=299642 RepID=A0A8X6U2R7_NEPPI|nr:hypothetical protein NPIL_544211 [Nephila pilipes]
MYIPKLHALVIPEDDIQHQSSFDSGVIMTIVQDPILWLQLRDSYDRVSLCPSPVQTGTAIEDLVMDSPALPLCLP